MKKFRKLVPALCMLLVSAVLMGTSTYAWFSMNNKVTVDGMAVTTKVSSNLMIAGDTLASTAKKDEADFSAAALTQEVKGLLAPVSTVNGTSFFYTLNAKADGSKADGEYTQYNAATAATNTTNYGNKFSEDYNLTKTLVEEKTGTAGAAVAYVDYVFQLKAVATEDVYLNLSRLALTYNGTGDKSKAFRVAVFTEDITTATPAGTVGTLQAIFTKEGAANQTAGKAVSSTTATDTVSYNAYTDTTNNTLAKLTAGETKYYKVVVRLWLEGEDTTCTNDTFKSLTDNWTLALDITLDTSASAVSKIG